MFRNYYVHKDLLRSWSDDGKSVSLYNPITGEDGGVRDIDFVYYFDYLEFPSRSEEAVAQLESFFSFTLSSLLSGNTGIIRAATEAGRRSILFQLTRLPIFNKFDYVKYGSGPDSSSLRRLRGRSYYEGSYAELCPPFLERVASFATPDSAEIMDLEVKFLVPPEGKSFIIGPSCFNVMNPYFEKRFYKCQYVDKAYDIIGTVLVLPLTPGKALMLYDSSVYDIKGEGDTLALSPSDTDILNMVQIYNSDIDGVVYTGDRAYLDDITRGIGDIPYRDGWEWLRSDRFPFSSLLSVMEIRNDAMKEMNRNIKSPLRPFVRAMRNFDGLDASSLDNGGVEAFQKRYRYAMSLIRNI